MHLQRSLIKMSRQDCATIDLYSQVSETASQKLEDSSAQAASLDFFLREFLFSYRNRKFPSEGLGLSRPSLLKTSVSLSPDRTTLHHESKMENL